MTICKCEIRPRFDLAILRQLCCYAYFTLLPVAPKHISQFFFCFFLVSEVPCFASIHNHRCLLEERGGGAEKENSDQFKLRNTVLHDTDK